MQRTCILSYIHYNNLEGESNIMIYTRQLLFPLAYYKKEKYVGSQNGTNFRIEKLSKDDEDKFLLTVWKTELCYDATSDEEKDRFEFPFSEEGMIQIMDYINTDLGK